MPAAQVVTGELIEGWIDMLDEEGDPVKHRGKAVRDLPVLTFEAFLILQDCHYFALEKGDCELIQKVSLAPRFQL